MTQQVGGLPHWLHEVRDAARSITVHELTRFVPPAGTRTRPGAVLMLFEAQRFSDQPAGGALGTAAAAVGDAAA